MFSVWVKPVRSAVRLPVKLVDVLYVAEQSADLLRFQWQSAAVDDTAEIILKHRETRSRSTKDKHLVSFTSEVTVR